jgi:hypothetical protein
MARFLLLILLSVVPAAATIAQGFDDEFNSMIMKSGWTWVREDRAHWQFTGNELQITTQPGALMETQYNDVKNILLQPAPTETFRFETKLWFDPDSAYHNAGLIYYLDDDNYIRVTRGIYQPIGGGNINGVWMEWEIAGVPHIEWVDGITMNPIHLRLSRTNGTYFFATYGPDGVIWRRINDGTISFSSGTPRIGLQAADGQGLAATTKRIPARFDYFHVALTSADQSIEAAAGAPVIERLYPQPLTTGTSATLQYTIPAATDVEVRVTDLLGRQVWSQTRHESNGSHELRLPSNALRPGTYWVHLSAGRNTASHALLITR